MILDQNLKQLCRLYYIKTSKKRKRATLNFEVFRNLFAERLRDMSDNPEEAVFHDNRCFAADRNDVFESVHLPEIPENDARDLNQGFGFRPVFEVVEKIWVVTVRIATYVH